jgi:type II secretory pathway pseudopilin PulG
MDALPKKKSRGAVFWVLVLGGGFFVCLACTGVLAAIGVPAFMKYVRGSKTSEADSNLRSIFTNVAVYATQEHYDPALSLGARAAGATASLPPSAPRTPATPPCGVATTWPFDADPAWQAIGFAPPDPIRYAYEYERGLDSRTFAIRAYGDLDCDGTYSTFELTGGLDGNGEVFRAPEITRVDEYE